MKQIWQMLAIGLVAIVFTGCFSRTMQSNIEVDSFKYVDSFKKNGKLEPKKYYIPIATVEYTEHNVKTFNELVDVHYDVSSRFDRNTLSHSSKRFGVSDRKSGRKSMVVQKKHGLEKAFTIEYAMPIMIGARYVVNRAKQSIYAIRGDFVNKPNLLFIISSVETSANLSQYEKVAIYEKDFFVKNLKITQFDLKPIAPQELKETEIYKLGEI